MGCAPSHIEQVVKDVSDDNNIMRVVSSGPGGYFKRTPSVADLMSVVKSHELIMRTDSKTSLPKGVWRKEIMVFMTNHIKQLSGYDFSQMEEVHYRLKSFEEGRGSFDYSLRDSRHHNAVSELRHLFDNSDDPITFYKNVKTMCQHYVVDERFEDFEHIALIFAIIVNSPMIF